jgi:C1A family cysteine protease
MTEMTRKYNVLKDIPNPNDKKFKAVKYADTSTLPASVDLSPLCSPVYDQGGLGSCTGFGIVKGLREFLLNKFNVPFVPLSALFLYYKEREAEGTIPEDAGAYIGDGMNVLVNVGVCPDADDPYVESAFANPPSTQALQDASQYKIIESHRVDDFDHMKQALAEGFPVVIGIEVYSSFESFDAAMSGMIPIPQQGEQQLGGHCMLVVGYETKSDGIEYAKVRNSWGTGWGQAGYCFIPRGFFDQGYVMDLWTGTSQYTIDMINFDQAVQTFVSKGIFDSPDFWTGFEQRKAAGTLTNDDYQYVSTAFIKFANFIIRQIASLSTLKDALDLFVSRGIFDSPDFWTNFEAKFEAGTLTNDDCQYVDLAFRKIAVYILNN